MQIGDIKMDQRSTTSSLALLDEIKVLAQKSEDRPVTKVVAPTTEKKKSTIELSFALDEIKNSISSAAFQEEKNIQEMKEREEREKEEARRKAEEAEFRKITQEIQMSESKQKQQDQDRHIEQLKLKYEAERLINPDAIKPQELVEIDEFNLKQEQARIQSIKDKERKEAEALAEITKAKKAKEDQAKKAKQKLMISSVAGILTLASALAFFILSTPEEPKTQVSVTTTPVEIKTSTAELERIEAIKRAAEEKKRILAEHQQLELQAKLDEEKKQKELEAAKKKRNTAANPNTTTTPKKAKINLGLEGF
jgi:hypothetical protein